MAEYIEREVAISRFSEDGKIGSVVRRYLMKIPSADVVEIPCRCQDCTHNKPERALRDGGIWCNYWGTDPDPDGWCYKGERREEK